jgi:aminoglycoside phosphotransferase (APT) family kinase protein
MERAFVGDQSFDLGFLLAHYLVEVPRLARSDSILAFRAVIASYRERLGHAHSHADQTFETRLLRWLGVMILYRISDSYMGRPIREDLSFWSSCAASLLEADSSDAVEAVTSLLGR